MRIVQFTDTHLVPNPNQKLYEVDTYKALNRAVDLSLALNPKPEAILVTGDLAEDGSVESYIRFRAIFARMQIPIFVVPGNHDNGESMKIAFDNSPIQICSNSMLGDWFAVFINSQVRQKSHGEIQKQEWSKIEKALHTANGRPTLLALHHPPLSHCPSSGCQLKESEKFLDNLSNYSNVKIVLSGHLHQQIEKTFAQMVLLTCPSTFAQGRHPEPGANIDFEDFWASHSLDYTKQGFRVLDLYSDGRFETKVHFFQLNH